MFQYNQLYWIIGCIVWMLVNKMKIIMRVLNHFKWLPIQVLYVLF